MRFSVNRTSVKAINEASLEIKKCLQGNKSSKDLKDVLQGCILSTIDLSLNSFRYDHTSRKVSNGFHLDIHKMVNRKVDGKEVNKYHCLTSYTTKKKRVSNRSIKGSTTERTLRLPFLKKINQSRDNYDLDKEQ